MKDNNLYRFNSDNLSYEKVSNNKNIFKKIFIISIVILLSVLFNLRVINNSILKFENSKLKQEYSQLNIKLDQYENNLLQVNLKNDSIYRKFLDMRDISTYIKNPFYGGSDIYNGIRGYTFSNSMISTYKKLNDLLMQVSMEDKSYAEILKLTDQFATTINSTPSINPVKWEYVSDTTVSKFGLRLHPILNIIRPHNGVDLSAKTGSGVYASADGKIYITGMDNGYGNFIIIDHGNNYKTVYGHLSSINVVKGQIIKRGDIIGLVGSTGLSSASHLHFEVRFKDIPVDPRNFFGNPKNNIMLSEL